MQIVAPWYQYLDAKALRSQRGTARAGNHLWEEMTVKRAGHPVEIGVDIGGTFTDIVCREPHGAMRLMKVPTTRGDSAVAGRNAGTLGAFGRCDWSFRARDDGGHQCGP